MEQPQMLEGTWEEILTRNAAQLAGRKVKVYIEAEEKATVPASAPNEQMLAILSQIEQSHKDRAFTDGSDTDGLVRQARAGAMFGYDARE